MTKDNPSTGASLAHSLTRGATHTVIHVIVSKKHNDRNELTERQLDCVYYLVKGMTFKQIGKELNLSPRTVEHYIENIKVKFDCFSRFDLITKALQLPVIKEKLLSA